MAIHNKRDLQELAGIPDSKPFAAVEHAHRNRIMDCHLGGVLISDLHPQVAVAILYGQTDEGTAEAAEAFAQAVKDGRNSGLNIEFASASETEKRRFAETKDRRIAGASLEESADPMRDLMVAHIGPGQRGRFMDPDVCNKMGMRGYTPVLDENGKQVTCGQSFLGSIPEEIGQARDRKKLAINASKIALQKEIVAEQVRHLHHAQQSAGLPVGATGAPFASGLQISRDIESFGTMETK